MTELRAPDPTLADCARGDTVFLDGNLSPQVAHTGDCIDPDDTPFHWRALSARDAAYIAIPCRECFPNAGPPGTNKGWRAPGESPSPDYPNEHLAWQVAVENAPA